MNYWQTRVQIFCNDVGRASLITRGLRKSNRERQWAKQITRDHTNVVIIRNTDVVYARDSMSAAFHAMQLIWDRWPANTPYPSSRLTITVNYVRGEE